MIVRHSIRLASDMIARHSIYLARDSGSFVIMIPSRSCYHCLQHMLQAGSDVTTTAEMMLSQRSMVHLGRRQRVAQQAVAQRVMTTGVAVTRRLKMKRSFEILGSTTTHDHTPADTDSSCCSRSQQPRELSVAQARVRAQMSRSTHRQTQLRAFVWRLCWL